MRCPYCKEQNDKVIDSRATEGGAVIRRRRQCLACSRRYTTYERVEETGRLIVVKKDGNRVPYDRARIQGSVQRACWKRPVTAAQMDALIESVEEQLFRDFDREVSSRQISEVVAAKLRDLDKIAYLRFASIYHEFQFVDDFIAEAKDILDRDRDDLPGQQDLFHD